MGHSAQKGERCYVPVQEGLGGLRRIGLDEAAVAVGQVDDEAVGLALHAADDHQGLAEVALRVARRVGQRDEHLPGLTAILSDVVLDGGVSAVEPVIVPQPLEDALGGVALLPGAREVILQDPVDDAGEELQLGPSRRSLSPVPPEARSRSASCAPCPGADRTLWRPPECSCPPPSPPGEPEDIRPLCTSIAPSMGSDTTLMDGARRSNLQPPFVSDYPPARDNLPPPLTHNGSLRFLMTPWPLRSAPSSCNIRHADAVHYRVPLCSLVELR